MKITAISQRVLVQNSIRRDFMEYRIPKKGEIYRHFKGNLYEIVLIARDSETLEEKVVYKEVEGDSAYVRALPMFVSLVDKEKYPNVTQEFRFELVQEAVISETVQGKVALQKEPYRAESLEETEDAAEKVQIADRDMIMEYLEQETVDSKIDYLIRVKDRITEPFISVVAQSLEFVENEGELSERYAEILRYLRTVARYESGRLR